MRGLFRSFMARILGNAFSVVANPEVIGVTQMDEWIPDQRRQERLVRDDCLGGITCDLTATHFSYTFLARHP
jgi:hypothetical protein